MGLFDLFRGDDDRQTVVEEPVPRAPTAADIAAALERVEAMVGGSPAAGGSQGGAVPSVVRARVLRVTRTIRTALPRLANLGLGSYDAYSVVATATDYLPEAIGAYLRLPRDWADTRPVDGSKTSLLLLIDQLDLLGATMDKISDAANRTDADALIASGRFLQQKFGHHPDATDMTLGEPPTTPVSAGQAGQTTQGARP